MDNQIITSVESLHLGVKIGVTPEERSKSQNLKIAFKIYQKHSDALENDSTEQYKCYANIVKEIKKYGSSREFKLIEYLCYQIYKIIKNQVGSNIKIYVLVEKTDIKVDDMVFNARAEYIS
ncbi:MAG: dihydroneopterin aldolase [Alphaproteobacteria bacterium]|nr:dihydroneopterin aldolase [Alphaproteobacteria bacterium]